MPKISRHYSICPNFHSHLNKASKAASMNHLPLNHRLSKQHTVMYHTGSTGLGVGGGTTQLAQTVSTPACDRSGTLYMHGQHWLTVIRTAKGYILAPPVQTPPVWRQLDTEVRPPTITHLSSTCVTEEKIKGEAVFRFKGIVIDQSFYIA